MGFNINYSYTSASKAPELMTVDYEINGVFQDRQSLARMSLDPIDPPVLQQQELLKAILTGLVQETGDGWQRLDYKVRIIGRYGEERLTAIDFDGSRRVLRISMQTTTAVRALRKVMAAAGTGAWFTASIWVDSSLQYGADFDYDNEPDWQMQPGYSEYPTEQERHPRAAENQPAWFQEHLAESR